MIGEIRQGDLEIATDFITFTQPNGKEVKLNKRAIAYIAEEGE